MKIKCITDTYTYPSHDYIAKYKVVIGKVYDVISYHPDVGPNGRYRTSDGGLHPKELFITIEEWREDKLKELGI